MASSSAHVIVVGGGVAGCTTAFFLAQEGARVTLIEGEAIGSHASGYAFGGLNPLDGTAIPHPLGDFSVYCYRLHQELAPQLKELSGVDNQLRQQDRLVLVFEESEAAQGQQHLEWQQRVPGFKVRWVYGDEARRIEPRVSPQCIGALLIQGSGAVEAYRHTLALAQAAERLGAQVRHGLVTGVGRAGTSPTVVLGGESLEADAVVLATGPWSQQVSAWTGIPVPVSPLKGQILRMRLPGAPLAATLGLHGSYAASKPDGLVWAGTTEEDTGFDDRTTPQGLEKVMADLLKMAPSLEDAEVVQQTACLRPLSSDSLPLVGPLPGWEGVYLCTGAGRKGILWSTGMGRAAADLVLGKESVVPDVALMDPGRFRKSQ